MKKAKHHHYRTVIISDTHLGTPQCKDKNLLSFLKTVSSDHLILNGDIIDIQAMGRRHYWNKTHTEIVRRILKLSEKQKVSYIVGNHDEVLRRMQQYDLEQFGDVLVYPNGIHHTDKKGRNVLILHGDVFDLSMRLPLFVHRMIEVLFTDRLSTGFVDALSKKVNALLSTEKTAIRHVEKKNDGEIDCVIIGHTHVPKNGPIYKNSGDWVHNCSFLAEDMNGEWSLNYWKDKKHE